jgi:hypothetical protein
VSGSSRACNSQEEAGKEEYGESVLKLTAIGEIVKLELLGALVLK